MEPLIILPLITASLTALSALVWGLPRLLLTVVLCITAITNPPAYKRLLKARPVVTRREPPAK
jgi:hypothetical protein